MRVTVTEFIAMAASFSRPKYLASATRARRSVALSGKPAMVLSREFDHVGHVWQVSYVTRSSDSIGHVRRHCEERIQHNGQRECKNSRDCAICLNRLVFIRAIKEALDESTVTLMLQSLLVELNSSRETLDYPSCSTVHIEKVRHVAEQKMQQRHPFLLSWSL